MSTRCTPPPLLLKGQDTSPLYTTGGEVRLWPNPITYIALYTSELLSKLYRDLVR